MPLNKLYHHIASTSPTSRSFPGMYKQKRLGAIRSEGVVLGRNLVVVEAAEEGDLLQDVGLDTGNSIEEEDGEDAGGSTEGGGHGAPVFARRS
jgi:hypothetical protein